MEKTAIIGGGAAGFFAALAERELDRLAGMNANAG